MSMKKQLNDEIPKLLTSLESTEKHLKSLSLPSHNLKARTDLTLLEKYRQDVHEIVDRHFDNLKLSYLTLSTSIPCKENCQILEEYIDEITKQLKSYQEKFKHEPSDDDVNSYNSKQFTLKSQKLENMMKGLSTAKSNKDDTYEEPEIHVNQKVYGRLYQTFCEFITTSLYHEMNSEHEAEKNGLLVIDRPDYFTNTDRVLPTLNEEQKSLSLYSLLYDRTTAVNLNQNNEIPYSTSIIITPDSLIYACGGVLSNGILTNKTYQFHTNKDALVEVANMTVKKAGHSLCYINSETSGGSIYSIGGRTNDGVRTKICERFDILANKWQKIALMNQARSRAAVCPFNDNSIYAFYGTGSNMLNVTSCERYDLNKNMWSKIDVENGFLGFEVSFAGAVQINSQQILVFGGFAENEYEKGSVSFSKKLMTFNVNNNTFSTHADQLPLDFSLSNSSTPIIDNKEIYCLGFFLQSLKPQTSRYLDYDYVLKISESNCEVKNMICLDKKTQPKSPGI